MEERKVGRQMKKMIFVVCLVLTGCSSASPLDILIPARRPSPATTEYLGHLYQTNAVSGLYYSVSDAKLYKALVPVRKMELQGLYFAAKGETELLEMMGSAVSNGIWGAVVAGVGLLGWQIPRPQEGKKVAEALHKQPPSST